MTMLRAFLSAFFQGLVLPVLIAGATSGWRILARQGRPSMEDAVVGYDLVLAAVGFQVAYLAQQFTGPGPHQIGLAQSLLLVSAGVLFIMGVALRIAGYTTAGAVTVVGLAISNLTGIGLLGVTFVVFK